MAERSYPRDWNDLLPVETARWVEQGIIGEAQRGEILKLYPAPVDGSRGRTVLIFSILGSLLLGVGVLLFFAANWPAIPAAAKVAVILAAMGGAYGGGYYLQYGRGDYPRLGHSLIFLGSLLYGAAIWLIAQIFHLNAHYSSGFLLWGVGLLPVVLVTASSPILYLSTLTLSIWMMAEQVEFGAVVWIFPVLLLGAVVPLARRIRTVLAEAAALVIFFLWYFVAAGNLSHAFSSLESVGSLLRLVVLYGVLLTLGGLARLGPDRAWLSVGAFFGMLGTYVFTFGLAPNGAKAVPSLFGGPTAVTVGVIVGLAGIAAVAWLYVRQAEPGVRWHLPFLLLPVIAVLGVELLPGIPRMVVFNLLLFAECIGVVLLGIGRRDELLVNVGLIAFIIHILTRYFDLFFSAMNRSVFFIFGGVLLLGGGWLLERNRRRWLSDWGGVPHGR